MLSESLNKLLNLNIATFSLQECGIIFGHNNLFTFSWVMKQNIIKTEGSAHFSKYCTISSSSFVGFIL